MTLSDPGRCLPGPARRDTATVLAGAVARLTAGPGEVN
jgi:hypothetical protein